MGILDPMAEMALIDAPTIIKEGPITTKEILSIKPTTVLEAITLVNNLEVVEILEFEIAPIV